jgi:DNA-binding MarR family transcriptional regulator
VRRKACAEDRRGSFAELTDEGLVKLQDAAPGHVEAVRADLFDALSRDQQRALQGISDALVAHLSDAPIWPVDGDAQD